MGEAITDARQALIHQLFPQGIPSLWCPPLTHYTDDGGLDAARITAHLTSMAPWVKGVLVPGSTGDGWELDAAEARRLLELVLDLAPRLGMHVLVGALDPDPDAARAFIADTAAWLRERAGTDDTLAALTAAGARGFAVCPPKGADVPQHAIRDALTATLELGLPTAFYQLPQVTENEAAPDTLARVAARFPNLYLMKDSSGGDHVATSDLDLGGLFLVRGAESHYERWLKSAGGPYDGFLLSTANCFAPHLHRAIERLDAGDREAALAAAQPVTQAILGAFELVDALPHGNIYTNSNKAFDHFLAHGPNAAELPPPRLHAGTRLPQEVIDGAGELLARLGLMPERGYLHA